MEAIYRKARVADVAHEVTLSFCSPFLSRSEADPDFTMGRKLQLKVVNLNSHYTLEWTPFLVCYIDPGISIIRERKKKRMIPCRK